MLSLRYIYPLSCLLLLLGNSALAQVDKQQSDQALSLIENMSVALREINYRGLFTYEVGDALQTYKIVHQVNDGVEHERLEKLDGSTHEVVRSGQKFDCLSPGHRLLKQLINGVAESEDASSHYQFRVVDSVRIAGRLASVVEIVPVDSHRYGYVFAVDTNSNLPLQLLLIDQQSHVLERIQFVELEVGAAGDDWELVPRGTDYLQADHQLLECRDTPADPASAEWALSWLPPGFEYTGQKDADNGDLMLIYSDGLTTFSVFVGPARWPQALQGRAQRGGTVAYMRQEQAGGATDGHSVAIIGEIPMATAQRLVDGLARRP